MQGPPKNGKKIKIGLWLHNIQYIDFPLVPVDPHEDGDGGAGETKRVTSYTSCCGGCETRATGLINWSDWVMQHYYYTDFMAVWRVPDHC